MGKQVAARIKQKQQRKLIKSWFYRWWENSMRWIPWWLINSVKSMSTIVRNVFCGSCAATSNVWCVSTRHTIAWAPLCEMLYYARAIARAYMVPWKLHTEIDKISFIKTSEKNRNKNESSSVLKKTQAAYLNAIRYVKQGQARKSAGWMPWH